MATEIASLSEIVQSQASKYVTHNTALRQLEGRLFRVLSATTSAEPGSPSNGDNYIIPSGATGTNWSGEDNKIGHYFGGAWNFYSPFEGLDVWVNDANKRKYYDGAAWQDFGLGALADVDLASPAVPSNGDVLVYDAASDQWFPGVSIQLDDTDTAGNTRLLLYDVDNGTLERVTVGVADSGGAGYKVLRIPN